MQTELNIAYGSDERQQLDIYTPDDGRILADIVLVHGGGWWQGDKHKESDLAQALTAAGFRATAVNYRLADGDSQQNLYPTQRDDVVSAVNWLVANRNVDRNKLVMWGASSGGNIALEAALVLDLPTVTWSGLMNLAGFMANHPNVVGHKMVIGADVKSADIDQDGDNNAYYKWLVDNLTNHGAIPYQEATVLNRIHSGMKPVFIANSMNELVPVTEVNDLMTALIENGVEGQTLVLPGSRHGEGYMADALPASITFVKHVLGLGSAND